MKKKIYTVILLIISIIAIIGIVIEKEIIAWLALITCWINKLLNIIYKLKKKDEISKIDILELICGIIIIISIIIIIIVEILG